MNPPRLLVHSHSGQKGCVWVGGMGGCVATGVRGRLKDKQYEPEEGKGVPFSGDVLWARSGRGMVCPKKSPVLLLLGRTSLVAARSVLGCIKEQRGDV